MNISFLAMKSGVIQKTGPSEIDNDPPRLHSFPRQEDSVGMVSHSINEDETESPAQGGSVFGAIFILMNAIMGASILVLPSSFGQIGIVTAVIIEVFVVFIGYISHMVLADAVDRHGASNYQELVGTMCGPTAQVLSQLGLILYFFTLSCHSQITMGDQAVRICQLADGISDPDKEHHWYCNRRFLIPVGSLIFIFPLIWVRNISNLSYISVFKFFAILYIVLAIIIDYNRLDLPVPDGILMPDVGFLTIMQYLPIFTLGFQCHMTSVPLYFELHNRSPSKYSIAIIVASFLVLGCYLLAAVFGLLTFGADVNPDILLDYPSKDGLMTVARGAISVSVIGGCPIFAFLGRSAIDNTIIQIAQRFNRQLEPNTEVRRVVILLVWHFLGLGFAILISSFGTVLEFVGSIAALFMLLFPGYMLWIESRDGNWGYRVTSFIFMFLGTLMFVWTIVFNAYQIATGNA